MQDINVVYACDINFINVLKVSLYSLVRHNSKYNLKIWIVGNRLDSEQEFDFISFYKSYTSVKINFIKSDISIVNPINLDRGSISAYDRLFLGSILPKNINRVLYLDADVFIYKDLSSLYFTDLGENIIGAVSDLFNDRYKKQLGIPQSAKLFNSGVILIDLDKWRNEKVQDKLVDSLMFFKGFPIQGDLGVLNNVLYDNYFELAPKYNMMTSFYDFSYEELKILKKPSSYYSEEEIIEGKRNQAIRHFTTSFASIRPWYLGSKVDGVNDWGEVMSILNLEKKSLNEDFLSSFIKKMLSTRFRKYFIFVCGLLQLYIRPIYYSVRKALIFK